jgi:hypothetical protein
MFANDELMAIIEEVDVLVTELRERNEAGPHFRILHRFHAPGSDCAPGEEIAGVYLVHRGREYALSLSLALRILFDYLARHCHLPQSATQIEAGIRADRFYADHATAIMEHKALTRRIPRSYVRVYIERLRLAIKEALDEAGLRMDVCAVLSSQGTVMNEVGYRLKATFEWVHIDG